MSYFLLYTFIWKRICGVRTGIEFIQQLIIRQFVTIRRNPLFLFVIISVFFIID